ncbi:hypothetical protein PoB_000114900 [Plakobranchus ocellatus]|uniref:Uncharacterized protein n=1 Tax=Plakobranchus ocellatus TaxID=259542 RepID=A0AAV3XXJ1_9GAST|nr:hypothetical protein PoB_000114900 [Plakobranchus ocellatus]
MNFVKDLKVILMDFEYENPVEVLVNCIIDRVVDPKLQEKLLDRGGDLSLSKAIEVGQQFHESKAQMKVLHEEAHVNRVDAIRKKPQAQPRRKTEQHAKKYRPSQKLCTRCGKLDAHKYCPAKTTVCENCKKRGH